MTEHILEHRPSSVLELGFRHGVSSCYIAAALDELGAGHLTTVDLDSARDADPNIEELLERLGLRDRVSVVYEPTSYTWQLMRLLESDPRPSFDLCYIDGAHSWAVDGFAFFLADRLLGEGGWLIFDDLDWTYEDSPTLSRLPHVVEMPPEERATPQVRKVWELLVKTHHDYTDFRDEDGWGFARKFRAGEEKTVATEHVVTRHGLGEFLSVNVDRAVRWVRSKR